MSLLTVCQNVAVQIGTKSPSFVVSNTDPQVQELFKFANVEGRHLAREGIWEETIEEGTFTGVSSQEGYDLPSDFLFFVNDSMWNRTKNWKPRGVQSSQEWQREKSDNTLSPYESFRIRGGQFLIYPTPADTDDYFFEYVSENWCESSGGSPQSAYEADDDVSRIDEYLIELGVIWRWKKSKAFDYVEDYENYQKELERSLARTGGSKTVYLAYDYPYRLGEGRAPDGSWS